MNSRTAAGPLDRFCPVVRTSNSTDGIAASHPLRLRWAAMPKRATEQGNTRPSPMSLRSAGSHPSVAPDTISATKVRGNRGPAQVPTGNGHDRSLRSSDRSLRPTSCRSSAVRISPAKIRFDDQSRFPGHPRSHLRPAPPGARPRTANPLISGFAVLLSRSRRGFALVPTIVDKSRAGRSRYMDPRHRTRSAAGPTPGVKFRPLPTPRTGSRNLQSDLLRCPVDVGDQRGNDVFGVAVDPAQSIRGERPLEFEPDVCGLAVRVLDHGHDTVNSTFRLCP